MNIIRWNPYEVGTLRRRMNRLFEDFWGDLAHQGEGGETRELRFSPPVDIKETDDSYVVTLEIPGVNKKDISVEVQDNVLSIRGERNFEEEKKGETFHRVERSYGSFVRSFSLPSQVNADKVEAVFKDGLLTLTVAKVEEAKPKNIEIKG